MGDNNEHQHLWYGNVGLVSSACLLRGGYTVCGVDWVEAKVDDLSRGLTPIQEPGVAELLEAGHRDGRLSATIDPARAVESADMIWICVGTPSSLETGLDLSHVKAVVRQIGGCASRIRRLSLDSAAQHSRGRGRNGDGRDPDT